MGIMDKLREEARELAEKGKDLARQKGQELLDEGKEAMAAKAAALEDQAAQKVNVLVDEQKKKLADRLPDILKK